MKRIFLNISLILMIAMLAAILPSCRSSKKSNSEFYQSQIDQLNDKKEKDKKQKSGKSSKLRKEIVEEAYTWLGTPYKYAHSEKGVATDCSGMVLQIYQKVAGIKLPRNSAKQAEFCNSIKEKDVAIGDLVFFATGKNKDVISHVGIMVDDKNFIHASSSKGVVISDITQSYYERTFKGFGRVSE